MRFEVATTVRTDVRLEARHSAQWFDCQSL